MPTILSGAFHVTNIGVVLSAAMRAAEHAPETDKRRRMSHPKVKTGCMTCKIRRKKCDETRPFCKRCTTTSRKCDGYDHLPKVETAMSPSSSRNWNWEDCARNPTLLARSFPIFAPSTCPPGCMDHTPLCLKCCPLYARMPSPLQLASEMEYMCFDFFRHKTGPGFAGYFDSPVWPSLMIEVCFSEPVVLQAVVAVGAVHRRFELGICPEAFRFCEIADRLYRRALKNWTKELEEGKADTRPEIYMMLAKLFGSFETFQDNPEIATKYMQSAFRTILNQRVTLVMKERRSINAVLNQMTLRQYFLKLEQQVTFLFGHSAEVTWEAISKYEPSFPMPLIFTSIEEARDCLFAEVRQIWDLPSSSSIPVSHRTAIQRNHLSRLMQWSAAYGDYAQIHRPTNESLLKRIGYVLRWYREAAFLQILLQTTPGSPIDDQMIISPDGSRQFLTNSFNRAHCSCPVSWTAHFARLILLSDDQVSEPTPFPCTGYGSSTGMGLHLGSASCRSSDIRNQMDAVMGHFLGATERTWDASGMYKIAERVSSFEELAVEVAADQHHLDTGNSDAYGVKWADIAYFMDSRMIRITYCKEQDSMAGDTANGGFVWCRDTYKLI